MSHTRTIYLDNRRQEALFIASQNAKASVIVIHEVWGLTSHIEAVCQRLSKLQLAAIAPNLYAHNKNLFTQKNIREAITQVWDLPLAQRYNHHKVTRLLTRRHASSQTSTLLAQLYNRKFRAGMLAELTTWTRYAFSKYHQVATIGFSMGGGLSFKLAAHYRRLRSCISFCGEPPTYEEAKKIDVPILAICAGHDDFMNSTVPNFVRGALTERQNLTLKVYGNAKHEFFNPMSKDYNAADANDAWNLAANFLERILL